MISYVIISNYTNQLFLRKMMMFIQGSDAAIVVNEELLNTFKVRAKPVPTFVSIWNSLGTQSQTTVSIWAPNTGKSILSSTVCILVPYLLTCNTFIIAFW